MKVYFDNAATTKIHPKVLEKMLPYLKENFGNPSSFHSIGREARVAIEDAREIAADFIGANPSEIYFTSGGTESINFALDGIAKTNLNGACKDHLITTAVEHKAVLEKHNDLQNNGFDVEILSVNKDSSINIESIESNLTDKTSLVSIIFTNNETGTINDIKSISQKLSKEDLYFFTDAVQTFGKIKFDVNDVGIDSFSASAHKIYGPKGVGLLFAKSGTPLSPLLFGGSQERERRAGTENVAGIVGFAEAIKIANEEMDDHYLRVRNIKEYFIKSLLNQFDNKIEINGGENTSPYILSVTFKSEFFDNDSEAMLMFLDINGVSASQGSACNSGILNPSHVILRMGKTINNAKGTMRFSFSPKNTLEEVEYTIDVLDKLSKKFIK